MLTPNEIPKKKEFQNKIKEVSDKVDGVKKSIDSIPSTYITKTDAINKFITNEALNPDTILTKESASNTYQVKGDYVNNSTLTTKLAGYQVKGDYLTSTNANSKYQVKGNYVAQSNYDNKMKTVDSDITDLKSFKDSASKVYQPKGDYLTPTNADSKYQVKGDYVTNSLLTTKLGRYQPKGNYLLSGTKQSVSSILNTPTLVCSMSLNTSGDLLLNILSGTSTSSSTISLSETYTKKADIDSLTKRVKAVEDTQGKLDQYLTSLLNK